MKGNSVGAMPLLIAAHLAIWICAAWLVAIGAALVPVLAIFRAGRHADRAEELERRLAPAIDRLSRVEAPSGTPFFAAPGARDELLRELRELALAQSSGAGDLLRL
jgi:hypothetical protein